MLEKRLNALEIFNQAKNPEWPGGSNLLESIKQKNQQK